MSSFDGQRSSFFARFRSKKDQGTSLGSTAGSGSSNKANDKRKSGFNPESSKLSDGVNSKTPSEAGSLAAHSASPLDSPALDNEALQNQQATSSAHLTSAGPESVLEKRSSQTHPHVADASPDRDRQQQPKAKDFHKTLLSRTSLRKCLDDPTALHKFGAFLAAELGAEQLVFWLNAQQHADDLERLLQLSKRIYNLHLPETAPLALNITNEERSDMQGIYQHWMTIRDPFKPAQDRAFDNLLADAWPRFILHRANLLQKSLIASTDKSAAPLDSFALAEAASGNDQPLIMLSKGFENLTGYSIKDVVGTNCRFLQGPGTSKTAIARIRAACSLGLPAQEMLLNHRKDGTPYWVLLRIEPLRDVKGQLKYLMAHQFNLSRHSTDLGWLMSDTFEDNGSSSDSPMVQMQQKRVDAAVKKHLTSQYENPAAGERSKNKGPDRPHEAVDRDQRLKDATALAAADAESLAQRPRSAHRSRSISAAVPSAGQQQQQQPKSTGGFRPTSAGSAAPAFGGASRRKEWQAISSMAQIGDAEEEADWQSRALAHFVFIEPGTGKIRFSSPRLPAEWAAGALFFTILEKTNPPYMVNNIKKLIKQGDHFELKATLHLFKSAERPRSEGRLVSMSITPLLDDSATVAGVVCLFGV